MSGISSPSEAATMADVLIWQARHRPNSRVFVFLERGEREAESITYAELAHRAQVIAAALSDSGLAGRRVILAYPTCIEFIAALFGCFYAGATAIPAPVETHDRTAARLRAILTDADAAAVLSLGSILHAGTLPDSGLAGLVLPGVRCLATDEIANGSDRPSFQPEPAGIALLQYTSGSTGNPRGVMLTHDNIMANQRALAGVLGSGANDVGVNWLPLYHDMGLIGGVLHTIYFGGFTALMPPLAFVQRPIRWLDAIDRYRASISMGPGFAYALLAQRSNAEREPTLDLSCWRAAICGGETIRPEMLELFAARYRAMRFDSKALMPAYGLAEATLIATAAPAGTGLLAHPPKDEVACDGSARSGRQLACCGPAVKGHQIMIVESGSTLPMPSGGVGEIWLQGPSIAAGYWNRPEETRAAFGETLDDDADSKPWLRTGDLGYLSAQGLVVTGRAKEVIIIRGVNFDPVDIETVACESEPVFAAGSGAAFATESNDEEGVVLVFEVRREAVRSIDVDLVASRVVEAVSRRLGLRIFDLVLLRPRTLPRTTSGKVQRHIVKEQYSAGKLPMLERVEHPGLGRYRAGTRVCT